MAGSTQKKLLRSKHQPTGCWIRVEKRHAIYARDGHRCLLCNKSLKAADAFDVTLDHIIPAAAGGSNHETNLYTACRKCNCSRQDKPLEQFASKRAIARIEKSIQKPLKKKPVTRR